MPGLTAILVFASSTAVAQPEYFVAAMKYGAETCKFCHATELGGEALNERGQWLLEERERREVDNIDVAWLETRGDEIVETSEDVTEEENIIDSELEPEGESTERGGGSSRSGTSIRLHNELR